MTKTCVENIFKHMYVGLPTLRPHTLRSHTLHPTLCVPILYAPNFVPPTLHPHILRLHTLRLHTLRPHTLHPHTLRPHFEPKYFVISINSVIKLQRSIPFDTRQYYFYRLCMHYLRKTSVMNIINKKNKLQNFFNLIVYQFSYIIISAASAFTSLITW